MDSYEQLDRNGGSFFDRVAQKIKVFKAEHPILFWVIIALVIATFVIIIVIIIIVYRKPKPEKHGENGKEGFRTKDEKDIPDEFAYVNSYILSTLGEDEEAKKLV